MNKLNSITTLLSLLFLLGTSSCYIDLDDDGHNNCIDGRGSVKTDNYNFGEFTKVSNSIDADINITTGVSNHRLTVQGRRNVLDHVSIYTRGGELIIESSRCINDGDITVDLSLFELRGLFNSGSADIKGTNTWETNELIINLSGSGSIDAILDVQRLDHSISGSGDVTLSGEADNVDISIAGSGDYRAFGLIVNDYEVTIAGSGDTDIFVSDDLRGSISGSGRIKYKGTPSLIDVKVVGSGKVENVN
ncbi:DUF2807 domain-containing protein [Fulvivirga sp. M361]|uniref:head GIN domain-containing protein n=1 Tax=Fulvivirga sp. M361 TaxID=2594266 RepID=UPI001179F85B|nr:head GIN domain-containing protein [Fulvivirga sp. M361]TRX56103.1 DUF2807 domain-containing protein [Fulvivirga sp. M361]